MPERVVLLSQRTYESSSLEAALRRAISLSGFDLESIRGKRVLLKPNMLGAYPPEMGVTTHPAFVAAVIRIFKEAGATVLVGDSPNGIHPLELVWEVSGLRAVCQESGAQESGFESSGNVERKGVRIARAAAEADIVVNLPKFKTHGLTVLTLAAKNLFGCVNGMQKTRIHRNVPCRQDFAEVIARIAAAVDPDLTLVDGIVAMEGNGPTGGDPVDLGCIVAGTNVHAIDAACCRLIGLAPLELDTLAAAARLGIWDGAFPELVGDPLESVQPQRFPLPATYTRGMRDWWISRLVIDWIWSSASAQPVIDQGRCERCLLCVKGCPVAALPPPTGDQCPRIIEARCIQCLCCHELCPHRAIELRRSLGVRIAGGLASLRGRLHRRRSVVDRAEG